MEPNNFHPLREKIKLGVRLAYEKLVRETALRDGELVFSRDGKIVHVKAKDLLPTLKS